MARAVLLLLVVIALAAAADNDTTTATTALNIFFLNDLRYHLFPTASATTPDLCQQGGVTKCFGGLLGLLALRKASKPGDVWLHSGAALGAAGEDANDYYRLLKHTTAVNGLNLLGFDAMSVDADMFRFGKGREVTSKLNGKAVLTCANCKKELTETEFPAFRRFTPSGSKCDVVVIAVIKKSKTLNYLPTAEVTDEVQAVKDAVAKAKAAGGPAALYVVIGEMDAGTVEQVLGLDDVGVVLSSGTTPGGTGVVSTVSDKKDKVSSTVPTEAARAMNVGQLSLTLDDKCTPTNVQPASTKTYRDTPNTDGNAEEQGIVDTALSYVSQAKIDITSAVALSGDREPCGYISCAIGQMAADGVHALINAPEQVPVEAPIAIIIPARDFGGTVPTALNWTTLLTVVPNDPFFCKKNISAEKLYGLLDDMLAATDTFPQVSGLIVDQHPGEDGLRVVNVWTRTPGLAMRVLPRDATLNVTVAMPCLAMQGSPRFDKVEDADFTTVALSDGLKRSVSLASATATQATLILPPQVEQRVRLYIADLSRVGCEDWVGMTVTYTLLVLGATAMVAYQGYQLWRFRTTLSYIR